MTSPRRDEAQVLESIDRSLIHLNELRALAVP
jgi:hypothetical protein